MNKILQPVNDYIDKLEGLLVTQKQHTVYSNLQAIPLFPHDNKIPFQWIQPGNVGNTGGGSTKSHGTMEWHVQPDNSLVITVHPVNINNKDSDDFFNYCILPYPRIIPTNLTFSALYGCKLASDWAKCQQLELQDEIFNNGFQYTCGAAFNPHSGFFYWAGAQKWQPFKIDPKLLDFSRPQLVDFDFEIDYNNHTYLYNYVQIGSEVIEINKKIPAIVDPHKRREFSVSVQQDGRADGQSYNVVLDNLKVTHN